MLSSERVLIEILHWACGLGATALNYVEATGLVTRGGVVAAVEARDALTGRKYAFSSTVVCNCAGPWSAELAAKFDRPLPQLFHRSLAFNVLFDCDPPSTAAVAVAAPRSGQGRGPVYFLCPAFGRLIAGTVHATWEGPTEHPQPDEEQLRRFISDINASVPDLNIRREQVIRVFAGLLPVHGPGSAKLSVRPVIRNHGLDGGPKGLVSVSGVKFTTARLVAEKTLGALAGHFGGLTGRGDSDRPRAMPPPDAELSAGREFGLHEIRALKRIVLEESVMKIDDLLFRRLNWAIAERDWSALRHRVSEAIGLHGDGARPSELNRRIDTPGREAEVTA